jgi:hypothetical protein
LHMRRKAISWPLKRILRGMRDFYPMHTPMMSDGCAEASVRQIDLSAHHQDVRQMT